MSRDPRRRSQVRMKCGEERFPKSPLAKIKLEPDRVKQMRSETLEPRVSPCKCLTDEQKTYGFSNNVLIHGWQKRQLQKTDYYTRKYRDCTRCIDMKSADWSPDMIIRKNEHPTVIFQAPVPPELEKTRCLFAVQLKSWYDEQYNDWAKRYLREKLYAHPDRSVEYMNENIVALALADRPAWRLAPSKVTDDKAYIVTECVPQNYGLLERKQAEWRKDIDVMLGRRVADTSHHDEFPSPYRTAVRQPPPPPPAACLRPRPRYNMTQKALPCSEQALCINCEDPSVEVVEAKLPCPDGLRAM